MTMTWWYWVVLGVGLAAAELLTPGVFFLAFFALSALIVGLLELMDVLESDASQWAVFTLLAIAFLLFLRRPLVNRLRQTKDPEPVDSLVGELAVPIMPIPGGGHGRAEHRGAIWNVRNVDATPVAAGERCRVVAVRGLELDIRAERSR